MMSLDNRALLKSRRIQSHLCPPDVTHASGTDGFDPTRFGDSMFNSLRTLPAILRTGVACLLLGHLAQAQSLELELRGSGWKYTGAEIFNFAGTGDSLNRPDANLEEVDRRRFGGRLRFGQPSGGLFFTYVDEKMTIADSPYQEMELRGDGWGLGINGELSLPAAGGPFFLYEAGWTRVENSGDVNVFSAGTGAFLEQRHSKLTYTELLARAGIGLQGEISPSLGVVYSDISGDLKTDGLTVSSRLETQAAAAFFALEGIATKNIYYRVEWLFGKTSKKDDLEGLTFSIGGSF